MSTPSSPYIPSVRTNLSRLRFALPGWVVAISLVWASPLVAEEAAVAEAPPNGEAIARLCVAHGRYCNCPGCRAYYDACDVPCPPGAMIPGDGEAMPLEEAPEGAEAVAPEAAEQPQMSGPMPSVSTSLGAIAAATSASPSMIGDFFGAGYQYSFQSQVNGAAVAIAGGDRILKFSDNNSPLPQNRLFFNYHMFADPVLDVNGNDQDVNRFTFGLERAFWDGFASIEFRLPFETGVDSLQQVGQTTDTTAAEFGNLALAVKMLLWDRGPWAIGGGLGIIFPTANDAVILNASGEPGVEFTNESFFLQPFLGVYYRPGLNLFTQFVAQVNFDVSGSVLTVSDPSIFFSSVGGSDRLYDQSLLFLDYSLGYWIYRGKRCDSWLTGVAPMIELHYSTTMEDLDTPDFSDDVIDPDFRRDALNITGGLLLGLGRQTSLRLCGVAPLRDENLMFDAEFGAQLIHGY